MKTLIIIMLLIGTLFPQITSITTVPPLNKTFAEVIRIEKIDTAKAIFGNGIMISYAKIDGDSANISYFFTPENRLSHKVYGIILFNRTGKAALKKFREITQKFTAMHGKPILAELIQELPETDAEKLHQIYKGSTLLTAFETDSYYIMVSLTVESETKVLRLDIRYISPDQWARIFAQ